MIDGFGAIVALPTASATSVVLLRILLELRLGLKPRYVWFDQDGGLPAPAAAAWLRIGDAALLREPGAGEQRTDLGAEWNQWTGLPFAFAIWQTRLPAARNRELGALHEALENSLRYFEQNAASLAERHAQHFGIPSARLLAYWQRLTYRIDDRMLQGLQRFYEHAAALGEVPAVPEIRWAPAS